MRGGLEWSLHKRSNRKELMRQPIKWRTVKWHLVVMSFVLAGLGIRAMVLANAANEAGKKFLSRVDIGMAIACVLVSGWVFVVAFSQKEKGEK
jgi:hypothetical protein